MQGLQSKLSDCLALQDSLDSLCTQLTPVTDATTASQFARDLATLSSRHASTSAKVDANIKQLQKTLQSWSDVRAEMDACSLSLTDAQQLLTNALPQHQHDLHLESDKLQVVTVAVLSPYVQGEPKKLYHSYKFVTPLRG